MKTVALIAASKVQDPAGGLPEKLFCGRLFQAQLAYARDRLPDTCIYVLSPQHGLWPLWAELGPFSCSLTALSDEQKKRWAWKVVGGLRYWHGKGLTVWFMAGKAYRDLVRPLLTANDVVIVPHPQTLTYPEQVLWYRQHVARGEYDKYVM